MHPAAALAQDLVAYDRELALWVLETICEDLSGERGEEPLAIHEMRAFLTRPDAAVDDRATSTREWKVRFGRRERARTLGIALADALRAD